MTKQAGKDTMAANSTPEILWEHPDKTSTEMWKFKLSLEKSIGHEFPVRCLQLETSYLMYLPYLEQDYHAMYDYSCQKRSDFWRHLFEYMPVVYSGNIPNPCVDESARMDTIPRWFKGVQMNFAENVLFFGDKNGRQTTSPGKEDDKIAVTEVREGSFREPINHYSWRQLRERVGRLSQAMRAHGVQKGDRIALVASTCMDTLTVFLAAAAIGAIFSSSSTDMGTKGILDRLLQIRPKFLFMDDAAVYNGKTIDLRPKIAEIVAGMTSVEEFEGVVTQCRFKEPATVSTIPKCQLWSKFLSAATSSTLTFEPTDFSDPFLIVYSSGTTGTPKCIVHGHGGVVLNGNKEARLHRTINATATQLQYTTTGWIMYAASVQALLTGARMITYDGSPFLPDLTAFLKLLAQEKVTHLGTSPKYLQALQTNQTIPKKAVDLSSLRAVTSTGMVLSEAQFAWFYKEGFPPTVHLDNISGGTDLCGAFATGNPILPVYTGGGCQCRSLGYAVEVYDQLIESPDSNGNPPKGVPIPDGEAGELVSPVAFPTMPVQFYGQNGAKIYFNSYFARFLGVWTHGDFISIHPVTKQVLFLGRADGVLNPSGVRFGSAEIYSVLEEFFRSEVQDSICVGQKRPQDDDERVVLFLLMKEGKKFSADLIRRVKSVIGKQLSKRHIPKFVFETKDIPVSYFVPISLL